MRIVKTLITDRTQFDVSYAEKLYSSRWEDLTQQEQEDFEAGLKGSYKHTDLNRVGSALITVRDRLRTHGIDVPAEVRTDYAVGEIPTKEWMDAYIESVNAVYASVPHNSPKPPTGIDGLDYEGANNIEKAIISVDDVLENREIGWLYADEELFAGDLEVYT